jgi:hypothetical protein
MLTGHRRETAFLRQCILYDDTGECHFPRYFDGLRIRSSRSASSSSRTLCRRFCLAAIAKDWGSNQACLTSWMMVRQMSFSVFIEVLFAVWHCPGAGPGRICPALHFARQETLISIWWGLTFSSFVRWTVSTPSLNSALTFPGLASSGKEKLRPKLP